MVRSARNRSHATDGEATLRETLSASTPRMADPDAKPNGNGHAEDVEDLASKRVFTTGEAAKVCKVSQQTIIRCFDTGRLSGFRVPGSKFRRIPRDELIKFMRANNIPVEALDQGKRRVLVVDDDPNIVDLFVDLLSGDGRYEVKTASTGYDAGIMTERFKPHLLVLDYMLPDLNGNIVCERVRAMSELAETRILFVSGVVARAEVDALLRAGADEFLQKPFDVDQLSATIERLSGAPSAA